nr:hypothetical protein Iba_chr02aCG1190 [Ipomoea batatas]
MLEIVETVDHQTVTVYSGYYLLRYKIEKWAFGLSVSERGIEVVSGETEPRKIRDRERLVIAAGDSEVVGRVESPAEEAVGDHEGNGRERVQRHFEVRFHELGGGGERREEGHGREFIGALDSRGDAGDVFRERVMLDISINSSLNYGSSFLFVIFLTSFNTMLSLCLRYASITGAFIHLPSCRQYIKISHSLLRHHWPLNA